MQNLNTCEPLQSTPIQAIHNNTAKHKVHNTYHLKPCGRIALASIFIMLAIICGYFYPQAGEGSVFFVIMALIVAFNKDIKITCKQ